MNEQEKLKFIINLEPYFLIILLVLSSIEYSLFYTNGYIKNILTSCHQLVIIFLFITYLIHFYIRIIINETIKFKLELTICISNLLLGCYGYLIFNYICIHMFKNSIGSSAIQYNKLEFIFTAIIYPIIYFFFIVYRFKYFKGWILKHKKSICFFIYIFIWLWFGCSYYYISQAVNKNNFIFNERAKLENVVNGVMTTEKYYDSQEGYVRNIIKNNEYEKNILALKKGKDNINLTQNPVGENWGGFYKEKFLEEGYTHFSFNVLPYKFKLTLDYLNTYEDTNKWSVYVNKEYFVIKLNIYKVYDDNNKITLRYIEDEESFLQKFNKNKSNFATYTLLLEENSFRTYNEALKSHPYKSLDYLIASSNVLLGNDNLDISSAIESYSYFTLEDFLYFSAVTITTLGYGDILPNNTIIRNLVMIESMLGVIVSGIYVSLLSVSKKHN